MISRRVYETTIIVNAALEDQDIDAVVSKVTAYIENNGGNIQEVEKWGRRRLAYPINKKFNGFYVHIIYDTMPNTVPIIERFLILEDTILRHLTLLLPDKLREQRQKRALEEGRSFGDDSDQKDNESAKDKSREKKSSAAENKDKKTEEKATDEKEEKAETKTEE